MDDQDEQEDDFNENQSDDQKEVKSKEQDFKCPDFIVVDNEAKITQLNYKLFEEIEKS